MATLVALCAAREGVSPTVYWYTRTPAEFEAAGAAWFENFAVPSRMVARMLGRSDEGGGVARRRPGRGAGGSGATPLRARDATYQRLIDLARSKAPSIGRTRTNIIDLAKAMPSDRALTPEERHRLRLSFGKSFKRNAVPIERPEAPAG